MTGFLLDANVSIETCNFLNEKLRLNAMHLATLNLMHLSDTEIIQYAINIDRVIITYDLDFGQIFHQRDLPNFGVILLRLSDQSVESANSALSRFFAGLTDLLSVQHALTVVDDRRIRFIR